jgi:hypothetical protein
VAKETYVGNVKCPGCGRTWTGEFLDAQTEQPCRDCIAAGKYSKEDSADIHINPALLK